MKFFRKNGRIIPVKEKKDGNVDKRHVSDKMLADAAANKKPSKKSMAIGAGLGAAAGLYASKKSSLALKFSSAGKYVMKPKTKVSAAGALLGALAGLAIGSTTITTKQEVANSLKKKATKKKKY